MDEQTRLEVEAAAFRGLVKHLQERTDVQNIDLMNLAGFCRNCLAKWYLAEAQARDVAMDYDRAREVIYGMPYGEWKERYQREATEEQKRQFEATKPRHANTEAGN
ncbi:hypothetical protein AN478_05880 [Thiohalorhabdus denitrificans]|uniref:SMc04008-like domain-containing protein n=1 Tax=Thiohalorhabdus denitrificans TaxID=381306 RepID=A0A0P9EQA6_9GAMM|nr:DUF1244 domain-containing protein [Thiohalorhabdus denitrificans]KPV40684.1 hypothetical protein AN478_05880 [Thiohalorhabdus denitrificans]SCY47012.1 hypothetical protein SAMN05661077_2201 [Thiohalorhabdus denitrificans]